MHITGTTRLTGLFGYPVKHTVSPAMHNAAFGSLGLDLVYLPFSVHPKNLKVAIISLSALGFLGINVTVPHKQTVMKYLDKITSEAQLIGAVNTILVRNSKLIGYNTDGPGFVMSLGKYSLKGKTMFLLGAGGGGHAVAVQSMLSGLKRIFIADKLGNRARALSRGIPMGEAIAIAIGDAMREALQEADIIVNATPVGLNPEDPISIPARWIPKGKLVYDLIYNPTQTKLLKAVRARGCKTMNGLGMLLYQGVKAFEIWIGKNAPVEIMRRAINKEIGRRSKMI